MASERVTDHRGDSPTSLLWTIDLALDESRLDAPSELLAENAAAGVAGSP